ncbi:hypothetical protein CQW23_16532 [Capsicum baccatum]|uniref:Uncharacterized protein n=1 Tax=Capsicum baccatum TaxID=33114 RepID=A0A2G2WBB1_CAPBA|nr:hypothetical protein CQW23_16532 [Capsicum baccatum]
MVGATIRRWVDGPSVLTVAPGQNRGSLPLLLRLGRRSVASSMVHRPGPSLLGRLWSHCLTATAWAMAEDEDGRKTSSKHSNTKSDEKTKKSTTRIVGAPIKCDNLNPPKLESKCNCTIILFLFEGKYSLHFKIIVHLMLEDHEKIFRIIACRERSVLDRRASIVGTIECGYHELEVQDIRPINSSNHSPVYQPLVHSGRPS